MNVDKIIIRLGALIIVVCVIGVGVAIIDLIGEIFGIDLPWDHEKIIRIILTIIFLLTIVILLFSYVVIITRF